LTKLKLFAIIEYRILFFKRVHPDKKEKKMPKCWDCCHVDPLLVLLDQACDLGNDTPDGGDTEACEDFEPKLGYTLGFGSNDNDDDE
jgi:hypothetical protein